MKQIKNLIRTTKLFAFTFAMTAAIWIAPAALAEEPVDSGVSPVCGTLDAFNGKVQVFDADRSVIRDVSTGMRIHCGDWVSVEDGTAHIRQIQSGAKVTFTAGSFAQIVNAGSTSTSIREHLVLYRGEVYANQASKEEFRIATPQARVTFSASEGYVLAQDTYGETQLLVVGGRARIQNRFVEHTPVIVSEGKFSKVGSNKNRNIPLDARFGEPNMMQERLTKFAVPAQKIAALVAMARKSARPSLPAKLKGAGDRRLASVSHGKADAEFKADQSGGGGDPKEPQGEGAPQKPVKRAVHAKAKLKAERKIASVFDAPQAKPRRPEEDQKEKDSILKRLSQMSADDSE